MYQVSEHLTPQGICRRLCELISSAASNKNSLSPSSMGLFWDPRIRKELGVIERVEVAVVKTSSEQERADANGLVADRSSSKLEQEVQELRERAEVAELARNELLTDVEQLREIATELSRQVDDADGTNDLTIPREKLEEVLRDAQERIDIAEARCEQLTVQVLLLQSDKPTSSPKRQTAFVPRTSSELGDVSQEWELEALREQQGEAAKVTPTHPPTHPHTHPPTHPPTHTHTHTHTQTHTHTHTHTSQRQKQQQKQQQQQHDEVRERDGSVSQEWPHAGEEEEEAEWTWHHEHPQV
jgi:hypothetical protein